MNASTQTKLSAARTVTVTGSGSATVVPDRARLSVTVRQQSDSVAEALAGVDAGVRRAGAVATEQLGGSQRVSSRGFQVWPSHDHRGQPNGFEARHTLSMACDDLTSAGRLLAALAAAIGDQLVIEGVSLTVADTAEALAEARAAAFEDARARAGQLAELGGARLGEVLMIEDRGTSDHDGGGPEGYYAVAKASGDVAFEAGERAMGVSLRATWALT